MMCKVIILSSLVVFITGCYVPAPEHGLLSGRGEIHQEDLAFLEVGSTMLADVLLRLGEPDWTQNDNTVLIYQWQVARGYWAIGGGYEAEGGPYPQSYLLLIEFDTDGKLLQFEQKKIGWFKEWSYDPVKIAKEWASTEYPDPATTIPSKFSSDYPTYLLLLFPDKDIGTDSKLAALPRLKVHVGSFESQKDPVRLGFKTAAFDVKVNEVFLAEKTTSETMRDAVAAAWQAAGHEPVDSGQDIIITGTVEKFEVDSPVHLLTWDAVCTMDINLYISPRQDPRSRNIERHYKTCQKVETLLGPGKKHFEQAVNKSIEDIARQMVSDTELISSLKTI